MPDPSSRPVRIALAAFAALVVALLIFHAGVSVGTRRAFRERGVAVGRPPAGLPHVFIVRGHGAIGVVEQVATSTFTLRTRDGGNETVDLASTTAIRTAAGEATTTVLARGDTVMVLGTPGASGAIQADLIRILTQ